ncbi:hypothetical protein DFP94_102553 [Fontibacillus phaseoli]|uniref:Uncharacterized protein n=1 Tax=Fontibacillus phaseoli TaxID=1416533 RepID=A0A369BQC1_9BACL|nr:hypothetical protein [Fontibacillus phaseoli]RCX21794.1 hypothetical protein DFP94_102553 [Fontibacillus phaseoli]
MKIKQLTGPAFGFLAGTTFGSGLAFIMRWQSYTLIASVSVIGLAGVIIGVFAGKRIGRRASL